MLPNLIRVHRPDGARAEKAVGGVEHHLTEGAVMVAFAMHLFKTVDDLKHVSIHPDGEHAKQFLFAPWLTDQGFAMVAGQGSTSYAGLYQHQDGRTVLVNPKSGVGDVVADLRGQSFVAECKGGVINSSHSGQLSRLRKGLCEAVGLSLSVEQVAGRRQFAVVPKTAITDALANKMASRAAAAGVEICLVDCVGNVELKRSDQPQRRRWIERSAPMTVPALDGPSRIDACRR